MKRLQPTVPIFLAVTALFAAPKPSAPHASSKPGTGVKCSLQSVKDAASQLVAFTYLMPTGWVADNSMNWTKPGVFQAVLSCSSPDGHYNVTQFEHTVISYNAPARGQGTGLKMHHAGDFLQALLVQTARQLGVNDVQVTERLDQPIPPEKLSMWAGRSRSDPMDDQTAVNETGFVQVSFKLNGVSMIGAAGSTVLGAYSVKHMPGRPDQVVVEGGTFGIGPTTVIVAPAEPTAARERELQIASSSMTMTPKFLAHWRAVTMKLAQTVIGANRFSQKISDDTFHERSMSQFRGAMAMKDAYTHQFCNYIQDLQDYKDARGQTVTLPSAYRYAWADGQGNYLLTDNPTVDPRGYGSGKWEAMSKARPGE